ncbi:MAG TPA: PorV/PorQ family protein [Bacteroidota bacterium]|nr:PorV/PorQ family protein [Bacteroidota bacterium]
MALLRRLRFWAATVMLLGVLASPATAQQKLAQAGMKWLTVGTDARASGMAGALTAIDGYSSAMFYNPAGMARLESPANVCFGTTLWIADINHSYASVAFRPADGKWGVFGISVQGVDYGDLIGTIGTSNPNYPGGYIETGTFSPSAWMIGIGYANAISEKFSVGGNVKYAKQSLGGGYTAVTSGGDATAFKNYAIDVLAFDLGVLYRTGFRSLTFGMSVRNFSREIRYIEENFQLPLTFRIGLSMNLMDLLEVDKDQHSFLFSVDAEHPRDYPEHIRVGGEYRLFKLFALRGGFVSGATEEGISVGVGVLKEYTDAGDMLGADYAYTPFGVFGGVHRFSFQISF